jgi:predicted small secreted protein
MTKVTEYLHCDKGDVSYNGEQQGLTDDQISSVIGAVYEVEFTIDADTGTILEVKSGRQALK